MLQPVADCHVSAGNDGMHTIDLCSQNFKCYWPLVLTHKALQATFYVAKVSTGAFAQHALNELVFVTHRAARRHGEWFGRSSQLPAQPPKRLPLDAQVVRAMAWHAEKLRLREHAPTAIPLMCSVVQVFRCSGGQVFSAIVPARTARKLSRE